MQKLDFARGCENSEAPLRLGQNWDGRQTALPHRLLILLCHKVARWQQGHLGNRRARDLGSLMRRVVIDATIWRSGRIGGSARSITRG